MKDINKEIEILENVEPYGLIKQNEYDFVNKELYIQAQNNLIKAYKELEEDNKQLKTRRIIGSIYDVKIEDLKDVLSPYYIPKSVIKEKIDKKQKQLELLKKELQGRQTNFVNKNIITGQIQVLQELLEKRK